MSTPDEGTEGSWVGLILHGGEGFRGGEASGVLVPYEDRSRRDRRGQGRPGLGPLLGPRSELPRKSEPRPPARGQRVLLCARRGLQSPRGPLPGHLAVGALVRTRAAEVKPDGFGRYLHPGGACDFYLEYDRGTEAFGALARKLEGYLRLAAGWTKEQELLGFPNLLIVVPEGVREGEVGSALRHAIGTVHARGALAMSFPLYVASAEQLTELGVLGPVWQHLPTDTGRISLPELPAQPRDQYRQITCLGRYFIDVGHRRRISPVSTTPRFLALPPRHAP